MAKVTPEDKARLEHELSEYVSNGTLSEDTQIWVLRKNGHGLNNYFQFFIFRHNARYNTIERLNITYLLSVLLGYSLNKNMVAIKNYSEDDVIRDLSIKLFGHGNAFKKERLNTTML